MRRVRQNPMPVRRGAAAVAMVLAMVAVGLVVVGFVTAGARDQDLSLQRLTAVRGFYAAEAGMNMALREVILNVDHDGNGTIGGITTTASTRAVLNGADHNISATKSGSQITLDGTATLLQTRQRLRSLLEALPQPAFLYGVGTTGSIHLTNTTRIDAYDSSIGVYDPTVNTNLAATVGTNTTSSNQITLANSATIVGEVLVGPGGDPNTVINAAPGTVITGETGTQSEPLAPITITNPSPLPASLGDVTYSGTTSLTLGPGIVRYNNLTIEGSAIINITGDTTIFCGNKFIIKNFAEIRLNPGATLKIYASAYLFDNNSKVNMPVSPGVPDPSRVTIYQSSTDKLEIQNNAIVIAGIIAPNAEVLIKDQARMFGAIRSNTLKLEGSARFTEDYALTSGSGAARAKLIAWTQIAPN